MELYKKEASLRALAAVREGDKGRSAEQQMQLQAYTAAYEEGTRAAIRDMKTQKELFDADLLARDYSRTRCLIVELDSTPDFVATSFVQPDYDFSGVQIQDLAQPDRQLRFMAFALLPNDSGGVFVVTWREDSHECARALADSLLELETDQIPHAIVRYVFASCENLFMSIPWWDSLGAATQDSLRKRMLIGLPHVGISPGAYEDDGVRAVNWVVTGIRESC
jgi:hypothetical protein